MDFELGAQQRELVEWAEDYARRVLSPHAFTWEDRDCPEEFWKHARKLADQGLLGLSLPETLGGGGLPAMDALLVVEAISRHCPYSGNLVRNTVAGPAAFIAHLGSTEHKERVVPELVAGKAIVSICMTESEAGTAASEMKTTARITGDKYKINGNKLFITNADRATAFVVYARFADDEEELGIGALIVDRGTPGLSVGEPIAWMGGNVYPVTLEDVEVAEADVLVPAREDRASYRKLMGVYNLERLGGLFELVGVGQLALDRSLKYSNTRRQFGRPIAEFQAIQFKLADMAMRLDHARWSTYRAAAQTEAGLPGRLPVSMARVTTVEMIQFVTNEAMQVHGGYGLTKDFGLEWLHRSTRHHAVAGGTLEIHRSMIAGELLGRKFDYRSQ